MNNTVVAKRYARALFAIAAEQKLESEFKRDLELFRDVLNENREFAGLLYAPSIDITEKKRLVTDTFTELHPLSKNLFFLLIDRHRVDQMAGIYRYFYQFLLEANGEVEAIVTSAFPLTEEDENQLIETFVGLINKKILVENRVDSELLGGIIVQIGDRVYDGSLRTKLKRFRERLQQPRAQIG